jgi:hypothetical protein
MIKTHMKFQTSPSGPVPILVLLCGFHKYVVIEKLDKNVAPESAEITEELSTCNIQDNVF